MQGLKLHHTNIGNMRLSVSGIGQGGFPNCVLLFISGMLIA